MTKNCKVAYEMYERYEQGNIGTAVFSAKDLYEVCQKLVKNLGLFYSDFEWEEGGEYFAQTQEDRDRIGKEVFDSICESNGDGCDLIMSLTFNGESLIDLGFYTEEEDWDE